MARTRDENNKMDSDVEIKHGVIVSSGVSCETKSLPWFNMWDFTIKVEPNIHGGDSGSPVFAFYDGKPVIIGIIRATSLETGLVYATRIARFNRYLGE
jgi:hypothetical protein